MGITPWILQLGIVCGWSKPTCTAGLKWEMRASKLSCKCMMAKAMPSSRLNAPRGGAHAHAMSGTDLVYCGNRRTCTGDLWKKMACSSS
eukprot:3937404-Rhodomonas_salina.4